VEDVCAAAPQLRTYEEIFPEMEIVESAMIKFYQYVLRFFVEALDHVRRCSSCTLRGSGEALNVTRKLSGDQGLTDLARCLLR
jgi:hypothetical protein